MHLALCIISNPSVKSNLSYSPETLHSGQERQIFVSCVTLKYNEWPWKTIEHLVYGASSFVHHFKAIGKFKLESGNPRFGSKSTILLAVWPWNLTDDLEKQKGTSSKQHQELRSLKNKRAPLPSNIKSYCRETAKWDHELCDHGPLTMTFCMDIVCQW